MSCQASVHTFTSKQEFAYTACYCEENVYKLAEALQRREPTHRESELFVVFVSNPNKTVPLYAQTASTRSDGLVVWDYHVILVQKPPTAAGEAGQPLVWDLDSCLHFPCPAAAYAARTLAGVPGCHGLARFYRVVPATSYLHVFASDRSHMSADGNRTAAPEYPCIRAPLSPCCHTLPFFWDMTRAPCSPNKVPSHADVASALAAAAAAPPAAGAGLAPCLLGAVLDEREFLQWLLDPPASAHSSSPAAAADARDSAAAAAAAAGS